MLVSTKSLEKTQVFLCVTAFICRPGFHLSFNSDNYTRLSSLNPNKSICIRINTHTHTLLAAQLAFPFLWSLSSRVRWNQCCHCLPQGRLGYISRLEANRDPLPYRHPRGWRAEITTRPSHCCVCNPRHYLPPLLSQAPRCTVFVCQ